MVNDHCSAAMKMAGAEEWTANVIIGRLCAVSRRVQSTEYSLQIWIHIFGCRSAKYSWIFSWIFGCIFIWLCHPLDLPRALNASLWRGTGGARRNFGRLCSEPLCALIQRRMAISESEKKVFLKAPIAGVCWMGHWMSGGVRRARLRQLTKRMQLKRLRSRLGPVIMANQWTRQKSTHLSGQSVVAEANSFVCGQARAKLWLNYDRMAGLWLNGVRTVSELWQSCGRAVAGRTVCE